MFKETQIIFVVVCLQVWIYSRRRWGGGRRRWRSGADRRKTTPAVNPSRQETKKLSLSRARRWTHRNTRHYLTPIQHIQGNATPNQSLPVCLETVCFPINAPDKRNGVKLDLKITCTLSPLLWDEGGQNMLPSLSAPGHSWVNSTLIVYRLTGLVRFE